MIANTTHMLGGVSLPEPVGFGMCITAAKTMSASVNHPINPTKDAKSATAKTVVGVTSLLMT